MSEKGPHGSAPENGFDLKRGAGCVEKGKQTPTTREDETDEE